MVFINETGLISQIIQSGTTNITGSLILTFTVLFIILIAFMIMGNMTIQWIGVLIIPFAIVLMAYSSSFFMLGGIILLYLATIIVKNIFIQ